jgi:hypothetical protein
LHEPHALQRDEPVSEEYGNSDPAQNALDPIVAVGEEGVQLSFGERPLLTPNSSLSENEFCEPIPRFAISVPRFSILLGQRTVYESRGRGPRCAIPEKRDQAAVHGKWIVRLAFPGRR